MKSIIFLFLSFAFCVCKGQKIGLQGLPDSVLEKLSHTVSGMGADSAWLTDTIVSVMPYYLPADTPENDTVNVVMLVCDTSFVNGITATWQYGFKVYDYKNEEILYLDEQKKRLPKTVIVWQDVEK